jgi:hypothetical protein
MLTIKSFIMTLLGIFGISELLLIVFAVFVFLLIQLIALVDILRSKFDGNLQLFWVIVVVFFNFIGSILYYFIGRNQKIRS